LEDGGRLVCSVKEKPYYFRGVTLANGQRVLAAQRMGDPGHDFDGPIFAVKMIAGEVVEGEPLAWTQGYGLYGVQTFVDDGKPLVARLSPALDTLQVDVDGERSWESEEAYGGRDLVIMRPAPEAPGRDQRCFFPPARMEQGPRGELLVPYNDGSRTLGCNRSFKKSALVAFGWDGYTLVEKWRTREQNGYLADFALGDVDNDGADEIVQAVVYSSGFFSKDTAALLVIEMQ